MTNFRKPVKPLKFICVLLIFIISFLMSFVAEDIPRDNMPEAKEGLPVVYYDDSTQVYAGADQIVTDAQYLFILPNASYGMVQVYDLDGNYLNSIAFHRHQNGAFKMAYAEGILYVQDKHGNLYLFQNGEFIKFLENRICKDLRRSMNFEVNSPDYEVRWGSVWRVTEGEELCIIKRQSASLLSGQEQLLIGMIVLFIFGFLLIKKHSSK